MQSVDVQSVDICWLAVVDGFLMFFWGYTWWSTEKCKIEWWKLTLKTGETCWCLDRVNYFHREREKVHHCLLTKPKTGTRPWKLETRCRVARLGYFVLTVARNGGIWDTNRAKNLMIKPSKMRMIAEKQNHQIIWPPLGSWHILKITDRIFTSNHAPEIFQK
jgi:hypothetical protein